MQPIALFTERMTYPKKAVVIFHPSHHQSCQQTKHFAFFSRVLQSWLEITKLNVHQLACNLGSLNGNGWFMFREFIGAKFAYWQFYTTCLACNFQINTYLQRLAARCIMVLAGCTLNRCISQCHSTPQSVSLDCVDRMVYHVKRCILLVDVDWTFRRHKFWLGVTCRRVASKRLIENQCYNSKWYLIQKRGLLFRVCV